MGCGVSSLFERTHPEGRFFGVIRASRVGAFHAHGFNAVLMFARKKSGSCGHAPSPIVGVLETNATRGEAIDVRCVYP